jgi:hypothetical protein
MSDKSSQNHLESEDVLLTAQLEVGLNLEGFEYKEELFAYSLNSMLLSANDVLYTLHSDKFELGSKHHKKLSTFDSVSEDLKDIVMYMFGLMNEMKVDTVTYQDMANYKASMPMIMRTDRLLTCSSLIGSITDLMQTIWLKLAAGVDTPGQSDIMNGIGENEEGVVKHITAHSCHILAAVDTLCHHYGKSIREVL